jgi:hypothetical protein
MREMQTIMENRDVTLCCALALIHAHKKTANPDKEAIQQLEVWIYHIFFCITWFRKL